MSLEYNIEIIYERYRGNCQVENVSTMSSGKLKRIFVKDYISFETPKSDTCAKCDEFSVNISAA